MDRDFYSILDIPRDASKEEIRQAYLRLARQYHPDISQHPRAREQFEKISQAYTILFNDESRSLYNHYCEKEEDDVYRGQLPWWRQRFLAVSLNLGIGVFAVLAGYGLVLYEPTLQQGIDTFALMVESKNADFQLLQKKLTQSLSAPKQSKKVLQTTPQQTIAATGSAEPEPIKQPFPDESNLSIPEFPENPEEVVKPLEQTMVPPPRVENSARTYELLAFYSLVIGDLAQFRNAVDLAYREDPSLHKMNALRLSFQQLESAKLPSESVLSILRGLVLREYSERLLPSQLKALKARVQNDEV